MPTNPSPTPQPPQTDLLSIVLRLHPLEASQPGQTLPRWWGRAIHACLLEVIHRADPALAERLHAGESGPRPFTVSTLMGPSPRAGMQPSHTYRLRLTALTFEVAALLQQAGQPGGPLAPGSAIELDYLPFAIEASEPLIPPGAPSENPYAAITSYQQLAVPYLLARQAAPRRIQLALTSPTSFKSGGMHLPLPLPSLVFGSLLEKWNAFAPVAFPPEVKRYAEECLAISQYHLSTRPVDVKSGGLRMGAVGTITYTTVNYDRYWMSVIATLAAFSLFAGVGAGTSQGLGQCRQVEC